MESFGEILRTTRESKGIDIPKAERETSISKEYIIALETENVSAFPGEPYLIGFLRNYSEYLGLDSKNLISLYKAKMIQEAPIPEGLLKSKTFDNFSCKCCCAGCYRFSLCFCFQKRT